MDQYKKIINAVDTEMGNNKNDNSRDSSQSSISNHQPTNAKHQKPYVYVSGVGLIITEIYIVDSQCLNNASKWNFIKNEGLSVL